MTQIKGRPFPTKLKDGLYRVEWRYRGKSFVAGFEVRKGMVVNRAPCLTRKLQDEFDWIRAAVKVAD